MTATPDTGPEEPLTDLALLGAFRACIHGEGISYAAHLESHLDSPRLTYLVQALADRGIVYFLTGDEREDHPAILDLKDEDCNFIGEAFIKTDEAWATLVRLLDLRADSSDCAVCEPVAHAPR